MADTVRQQAAKPTATPGGNATGKRLHPAWQELMRLCELMGYGEIERLKIHDGLPVMAEVTRRKVRLIPP